MQFVGLLRELNEIMRESAWHVVKASRIIPAVYREDKDKALIIGRDRLINE